MARYLSTQYPNKNSIHQHRGKKEDRNGKKGDRPKSEDKDNNTTGTAGAHIGDTTTPEDSILSSGGASIGAHVLEATGQSSRLTRSVKDILGAHPLGGDEVFGGTNPSDVSIDTANSKEVMAGSHITEQHRFKFRGSVQPELLNMTSYKSHKDKSPQNFELDFKNDFKDWNILSNANNVTNNVANTPAINILKPRKSRLLQLTGSTIYWSQIRWWSITSHIRIGTQHYSRRKRRRRFLSMG